MAARKKSGAASREIAIYLRLSSADGTEAESNSIGNQRSYLHQWAVREGWQIVAEFLDDGHTGTGENSLFLHKMSASVLR